MTFRSLRLTRFLFLPALLMVLLLCAAPTGAEPTQGKQDPQITQVVMQILQRRHLRQPEINEEIAGKLVTRFVKDFDPARLYFEKSDIDEFRKDQGNLPQSLLLGDLRFPYKVYERFLQRVTERQKLVEELVAANHDYTLKETLDNDEDATSFAAAKVEVRERWRKRIKFDLLMQRVGEKPVAEDEAKKKVLERYRGVLKRWKQFDNADLLELYLTDLTTTIDPHSTYMSPSTLEDFAIAMRLNLDGIGAVLRSENGNTVVVEVVPGGPAGLDGRLKANDKIVGVAQGDEKYVDVVDMKLRDVVKMIRGKRDTKVQLKVIPVGKIEPVVYELTRKKVEMKSQEARGDILEQGKKADGQPYRIGILDLPSFYGDPGEKKSATEDVRRILLMFKEKKVDGVVLDLRRNGGGSLHEALSLTGLFFDQGPVVQVKGTRGKVDHLDDPEKGTVYSGPLVVLVSRLSASASEILAGALQDYGRALIVGDTTTYGKGTVQKMEYLDEDGRLGVLKLTIQQFYRVNGDSTQLRGVLSDVIVPSLSEAVAPAEKDSESALAFDKVKPIDHAELGLIVPEVKTAIAERSAQRIKESNDFAQLTKDIELFKARKARKVLPLNEKELRDQIAADNASKLEDKIKEIMPESSGEAADFKFKRNFVNDEILKIAEDFIQGRKLLTSK
jgi:carboxyl-terminal processing protease